RAREQLAGSGAGCRLRQLCAVSSRVSPADGGYPEGLLDAPERAQGSIELPSLRKYTGLPSGPLRYARSTSGYSAESSGSRLLTSRKRACLSLRLISWCPSRFPAGKPAQLPGVSSCSPASVLSQTSPST